MTSPDVSPSRYFQLIDYEEKQEKRAVEHRRLDRNNMTICRSPTRDMDTMRMKNEMHRKRQEEFSKRRLNSCSLTPLLSAQSRRTHVQEEELTHSSTSFSPRLSPGSIKQSFTPASMHEESEPHLKKESFHRSLDSLRQRLSVKNETGDNIQFRNERRTLHSVSVQTEYGITTVKEADIDELAKYLEEALYREETLKKKLTNLQKSASILLRSTELLWKTRCDEDALKSKISALEAQLQVFLEKVPRDDVKNMVLKIEQEKEQYKQKAMETIQKSTEENAEAQSKMQNLQEALQVTQAESVRCQKQCEELRDSCSVLRDSQEMCVNQLLQLQSQLEHSRGQEESLREQCRILQQDCSELRYSVSVLEQDNLTLREQLEKILERSYGSLNNITELNKQDRVLDQLLETDNIIVEQLRQAEERLKLKEKECMELKAELEALEQECYSYQTRLAQCRDELNTLNSCKNTAKKKRGCCSFVFCLIFFFVLLLITVMAALWIYYPPIREKLRNLYTLMEEEVEEYLMQVASAQHSGCFRPI